MLDRIQLKREAKEITRGACVSAYVMSCVRRVLLLKRAFALKSWRCARPEIPMSIIYNI
jgi:hypothetical protein